MDTLLGFGIGMGFAACITFAFLIYRFVPYRGKRVIVCPETLQPAGVELDAWRAARTPEAQLRLQSCSRWPEKEDCDQDCLRQIEAFPEGTLVRNIVSSWYRHKRCVYCNRRFVDTDGAMPALRAPDGSLLRWEGIAAADVPSILATHK